MERKPTFFSAALDFLEGKGFYLLVLLCVAVVGFSGWYLTTQVDGPANEPIDAVTATATAPGGETEVSGKSSTGDAPVSGKAEIRAPATAKPAPSSSPKPSSATPAPTVSPKPAVPSAKPAQTQEETGGMSTPVPLVYTWPVKGEVLTGHSADQLVYNETMGDWRVHEGMDIAAAPGSQVLATAAGTVTAVDQHDLMGTVVTIDHGEGMVSRYANLRVTPDVAVGDEVRTGTVIGAVGETAIAESAIAGHLHFELSKDGAAVDPLEYLPQP